VGDSWSFIVNNLHFLPRMLAMAALASTVYTLRAAVMRLSISAARTVIEKTPE
jgi:hypothetical protein